jgi:hypothetical protein
MANTDVTFRLFGRDVSAGRTLNQVGDEADRAGDRIGDLSGRAFAVGGAIAAALGAKAVQGATDLNETVSKVGVIFGEQAGEIERFAATADKSLGQSKQSAMDAAATFATFGQSAGLGGQDLSRFSTDLVKLTSDMASFGNTTPEEAIEAVGSALRGEAEPIRKYGVLLDDATLRQEAMRLGLVKTTKEALTPSQKVLAAQAAIMKQTSNAQGDFARTADGAANKQRILAAETANASAAAGNALLPAWQKTLNVLVPLATWTGKHTNLVMGLTGAILGILAITKAITVAQAAWTAAQTASAVATKGVTLAMNASKVAFASHPIGLIVIAVIALVAALVLAYKKSATFRAVVQGALKAVGAAFGWLLKAGKAVFGWVSTHWQTIAKVLAGPVGLAVRWVIGHRDKIVGAFKALPGKIKAVLKGLWDPIWTGFKYVINKVIGLWNRVAKIHLPGFSIGGKQIGGGPILPPIPALAAGGIVTRPTLALLGEAGPEAVVPLGRRGTGTGEVHHHWHFHDSVIGNEAVLARTVTDAMRTARVRGGISPAQVRAAFT